MEASSSRSRLRRLRAALLDPAVNSYVGADAANATRIAALTWLLSAALIAVFFPFDPPTARIGAAGWIVAALAVVAGVAVARALIRHQHSLGFNEILALSYLGVGQIALLEWLAGGYVSAYHALYLLWIGVGVGINPPRRALAFLAFVGLAAYAPLLYDGWQSHAASEITTQALMWSALGFVVLVLMVYVRAQRVRLRADEERAQKLARVDPLTELGNRRSFDEALEVEIARTRRAGSTLAVGLLDLDDFKALNDEFGHLEGDRCLASVADAIRRSLRGGDRGYRWGGDEFVVLLADTDLAGAEKALRRIEDEIASSCFRPIAACWGVAELDDGMEAAELIDRADLELFAKKRGTRERGQLAPVEQPAD